MQLHSTVRYLIVAALLPFMAASLSAGATDIAVGDRLPDLSIEDRGELVLQEDDVSYRSWRYPQEPGQVHVVQYMAATKSAGDMNKPFRDRLDSDLPANSFRTTTILNMDEAIWGTGGFVMSQLKSNKRKFPKAVIVVDEDGMGLKRWQLQEDSAAVLVVDQQGKVRYIKQGKMSPQEIDSTLQLILAQIEQPD